jgi:hypothetical protein
MRARRVPAWILNSRPLKSAEDVESVTCTLRLVGKIGCNGDVCSVCNGWREKSDCRENDVILAPWKM